MALTKESGTYWWRFLSVSSRSGWANPLTVPDTLPTLPFASALTEGSGEHRETDVEITTRDDADDPAMPCTASSSAVTREE